MKNAKKLISLLLTAVILLSAISTVAFAAELEINVGETLTVTPPLNHTEEFLYIKFVPEKDGDYALRSNADEDIDPYCELFSSDMDFLGSSDDVYEDLNFDMFYTFEAGETYYFGISTYTEEHEYTVTLVCLHVFENETCTVCGETCSHEPSVSLPFTCDCGKNFYGTELAVGDEVEHDCADYNNENGWYKFIPEESGAYSFESISDPDSSSDPYSTLLDKKGDWILGNDDYNDTLDFRIVYYLEAGETYYYSASSYYEDDVFTVKFDKFTHTNDAGEEHNNIDYVEEVYSNCTEHGYTEGLYCNDCEEFIFGHEETELDEFNHIDEDWDGYCDLCGEEIIYICECLCHNEIPFFAFIWKIANFFHSIFGILPICDCGDFHYLVF